MNRILFVGLLGLLWGLAPPVSAQPKQYATIGQIIRLDPALDKLIPQNARIEIVAAGFDHLEGPVWVGPRSSGTDSSFLLVNDTKAQITFKWSPVAGLSRFIEHTGYTGPLPYSEEPGSNGMTLDGRGQLLICDHGDRRVTRLSLQKKEGKQTLTDACQGKRYNSPNDVIVRSNGDVYFTDPPFGLPGKDKDPGRELPVNGVYRVTTAGVVTRVVSDMTLPNGLAFSPDQKHLYVTQADSLQPHIYRYPVLANGSLGAKKLFFDASGLPRLRPKEVPDGLKVDQAGNCWMTGPGGLAIISPAGKLLGRLDTGEVISNCAWGDDGKTLYLASSAFLCRIRTTANGILPGLN